MRRLHVQIFGALCVVGAICAALAFGLVQVFGLHAPPPPRFVRDLGAFIVDGLPSERDDPSQHELKKRARRLGASISVWDANGNLTARAGKKLPPPPDKKLFGGDAISVRGHTAWLALEDGRVLGVAYDAHALASPAKHFGVTAGLGLLVLVLGSYVSARHITRRLARLELAVNAFGAGALDTHVEVSGRDEVAHLAVAFNRAMERISRLLGQQRRMLQNASHELRSPLARVRMAVELLSDPELDPNMRSTMHAQAEHDIEELDVLIGDLLLAERLTDSELPREFSAQDLGQIAREECARVGASCELGALSIQGNGRMLRSLVRNLLENARRYGKPPIVLSVEHTADTLWLRVDDAGEGIPEAERERVFEPFYRRAGHHEGRDGGVGLGLSLVKSVAEHHGGSVRYEKRAAGSRFEVRLPA